MFKISSGIRKHIEDSVWVDRTGKCFVLEKAPLQNGVRNCGRFYTFPLSRTV